MTGRGRPTLPPTQRRTAHVDVRFTPAEKAALERAAAAAAMDLSPWIRVVSLSRMEEDEVLARATAGQISALRQETASVLLRFWEGEASLRGRVAVALLRAGSRVRWWLHSPAGGVWDRGEADDVQAADGAALEAMRRLSPTPVRVPA